MQFEQNFLDKHFWDSDNQILYDGYPKDKWITKFFSYSAHQSFLWRGHISAHPGEEGRGGGSVQETGSEIPKAMGSGRNEKKLHNIASYFEIEEMQRGANKNRARTGIKG